MLSIIRAHPKLAEKHNKLKMEKTATSPPNPAQIPSRQHTTIAQFSDKHRNYESHKQSTRRLPILSATETSRTHYNSNLPASDLGAHDCTNQLPNRTLRSSCRRYANSHSRLHKARLPPICLYLRLRQPSLQKPLPLVKPRVRGT